MITARFRPSALGTHALVGLTLAFITQPLVAASPETIVLGGVVRDFRKAHEDFNVDPIDGTGHYAGNVDLLLDEDGRPVFTGNGFLVGRQWRNFDSEPIPPHLYREADNPAAVRVAKDPILDENATVDTWDSSLGPYGVDGNIGPAPLIEVSSALPHLSVPAGMGASLGDLIVDDAIVSGSLHCDDLTITGKVRINGDTTILCEGSFEMATHSDIELLAGATLALYVKKDVTIMPHANLNALPGLPGLVTIYVLGAEEMRISQPLGVVYANVVAPDAYLRVMPNADFFGTFVGKGLEVKANAGFHVDDNAAVPLDLCGQLLKDRVGAVALPSSGAVTSADTFDQWYRDLLGVSLSKSHSITLVQDALGVYEYSDHAFYPIDGMLFGNEGDAHNYYFTYAVTANFEYQACGGQFVEFMGSDDAWMFVDDDLAMDLGGVVPGTEQVVELDRLGLVDGEVYELSFFFAHRFRGAPQFHLRTNVELWTETVVATASFPCD